MEILVDGSTKSSVFMKAKTSNWLKKMNRCVLKDRQIAEKIRQLDQQQQLTLQELKNQETLQLELDQASKKEVQASRRKASLLLFGK